MAHVTSFHTHSGSQMLEMTVEDGSFDGMLPVGSYELLVHKSEPRFSAHPAHGDRGSEDTLVLGSPMPSTLTFHVWDDFERALPAKVSIFPVDDAVDV